MPRHPLTRRDALKLGAATAALGALRPGAALAAPGPVSFSMALDPSAGAAATASAWRTTRVLAAPARFDLIGLGWARGGHLHAQVRARRRGGRWTRWAELHPAGDHGPDAGRGATGSDPAWTGAADEFQLRLAGQVRGLCARFVHAGPAARGRRPVVATAARRQAGAPPIIARSAWGGDSVTPRSDPAFGQVQMAFVHHTVNANEYAPEESAALVLGMARYHRDHNGWNDLGYNFVIDQYGQIFEGRAGGVELAIVGAQAQGFNSVSTGIACLGTYTSVLQTEAGMDALARLIGWKLSLHGVPVSGSVTVTSAGGETNRFAAGQPVTFERIAGHRDGNATSCPGDSLYGQLADLRLRAARYATSQVAQLTVRASATMVRGAVPTTLSGTLSFSDGGSPAGARVEILYSSGATADSVLATTTCDASGGWSVPVGLPRTGAVRARFAGDGSRQALESAVVEITVLPRIELGLSASRLRRGRRLAISGVLSPAGERVELLVERKVRGRYRRVQSRPVRVRDGRYLTYLRPQAPGLYRVTLSVPGALVRRYVRVT